MHLAIILTTALLVTLSAASTLDLLSPHFSRRHLSIKEQARRDAHSIMNHQAYHVRRHAAPQAPSPSASNAPGPNVITGSNANFDRQLWNASVTAACMDAMLEMNSKSMNPSGVVACYNVPFLDEKSGVFEADLRLYSMAEPSGNFEGVKIEDFGVTVSYLAAQITQRADEPADQNATNQKRDLDEPTYSILSLTKRQATTTSGDTPQEVVTYDFVGAVNSNVLEKGELNMTQYTALLSPLINLATTSPKNDDLPVNVTIDSDTISFVAGKFAGEASTNTTANVASATAIASAAAAFVLPGTSFGIFPTGFIITLVWTFMFVGIVGYGTWGRIQFRGHYRRRLARSNGLEPLGKKKIGW